MATEKRQDLISRKDLIKAVESKLFAIGDNTHPYEAIRIQGKYFREVVDNAPQVDAVEVVHGRWILAKPRVKGRNATYRCTACGKLRSSYYNDVFQWEYCPCGAKMDGDGNGA